MATKRWTRVVVLLGVGIASLASAPASARSTDGPDARRVAASPVPTSCYDVAATGLETMPPAPWDFGCGSLPERPAETSSVHARSRSAPVGCGTFPSTVHGAVHRDVRCEAWTARYNEPIEEYDGPIRGNRAMATSPDGKMLYVGGTTAVDATAEDLDALLIAYDAATAQQLWVARYEGQGDDKPRALAYAMDVDPTGRAVYVLATATPLPTGLGDSRLLSFDAHTGELLWNAPLVASWGEHGTFGSLQVAPDGSRVYATGNAPFFDADGKRFLYAVTAAYEARDPERLGRQIWTSGQVTQYGSFARHVAVTGDGDRILVGGSVLRPNGRRDGFTTVGYDAATGTKLWQAHEPGAFPDDLGIPAMAGMAVSPDGGKVFVTGADQLPDQGASSFHVIVVYAYDTATGNRLWISRTGGEFPTGGGDGGSRSGLFVEVGSPIATSPDGSAVYVAGTLTDFTQGQLVRHAVITVALNPATGAELWRNEYDEGRPRRTFWPYLPALAVSDDQVFVTGARSIEVVVPFVTAQYEHEFSTVAIDASTGVNQWVGRWGEGQSRPGGIAINPDGSRVFVAGDTLALDERTQGSWDLVTVAYDTEPS